MKSRPCTRGQVNDALEGADVPERKANTLFGGAVRRFPRHSAIRLTAVIALAATISVVPGTAYATPPPSSVATSTGYGSAIARKQAERAEALEDLEQLRNALSDKITDYVEITRNIEQTSAEMEGVVDDIAIGDLELARVEESVRQRAVQLYRGDRMSMFEILLGAQSLPDLMSRASYLVRVSDYDRRLLKELRLTRSENEWLREYLDSRRDRLARLQALADVQRESIEADMAHQEGRARALGEDIAALMRQQEAAAAAASAYVGSAPSTGYIPDMLVSDTVFRASASMTATEVQAFLEMQPGRLKDYSGPDHAGQVKTAAEMIAEAAVAFNVSPKVILVVLQKEQSLLGDATPTQTSYDWAMGCGKADSRTFYEYQGFGNQIWGGADKLSHNAEPWQPGTVMTIDGSTVRPANSSTYSLYKYTPHLRGTMSFWLLYWRYFGDPLR